MYKSFPTFHYFIFRRAIIFAFLLLHACNTPIKPAAKTEQTEVKKTVNAKLVSKSFVKKNGQETDVLEWYAQINEELYFIKFCESQVPKETIMLNTSTDNQVLLEVSFKNGYMDICDSSQNQQSRMGEYIVIHALAK